MRRGIWQPPAPPIEPEIAIDPGFHAFASEWLESRRPEIRPTTYQAYRHELVGPSPPFFASHLVSQITVAEVDRYREQKLREGQRHREALAAWRKACVNLKPDQTPPPRPKPTMAAPSYVNATLIGPSA